MQYVEASRVFPCGARQLFQRYTDHEGWTEWAGVGRVTLVRDGVPERNGVGATRAFALQPGLREQVTVFEPPVDDRSAGKMEYRIIAGPLPLADHRGEALFVPDGAGTRLTWRASFRMFPGAGWIAARALDILFARMLRRLERDLLRPKG
jgi:hypothetical protein